MDKILLFAAIAVSASASYALNFVTDVKAPSEAFLSKTGWVDSSSNNPVKLRGKPSRNDSITFRCYEGDFVIDSNLDARSLAFYEQAFVVADKRRINALKGGLTFVISSNPSHTNRLWLKDSEMTVAGSVSHSPTSGNKTIGMNVMRLENSKFSASGNMDFTITSTYIQPVAGRSGVKIELMGNSFFKLRGDLLVDSILETNQKLLFELSFEERNGIFPKMSVNRGVLGGTDLRIKLDKPKKGRYTLFESTSRKPLEGMPRSVQINGQKVEFGTPVKIGDSTCVLSVDYSEIRDKTKNDIILTVE